MNFAGAVCLTVPSILLTLYGRNRKRPKTSMTTTSPIPYRTLSLRFLINPPPWENSRSVAAPPPRNTDHCTTGRTWSQIRLAIVCTKLQIIRDALRTSSHSIEANNVTLRMAKTKTMIVVLHSIPSNWCWGECIGLTRVWIGFLWARLFLKSGRYPMPLESTVRQRTRA